MARLPKPGSDSGKWGDILNNYLAVSHDTDGTLQDGIVTSATIADGAVTAAKIAATAGANDQVLTVDNTQAAGVKWSTPSSTDANAVHKGDLFINVMDYGAVGNNVADDTAALQAAINAGATTKKQVIIPSGTFKHTGLTLPSRVTIRGSNRGTRVILNYTGTGTAIRNATPGVRIYDICMSDILMMTSTGAYGVDLDSVSGSSFTNVGVTGFSTAGFYLHSDVDGGSVYNRFCNVNATNTATGFLVRGLSSNGNVWHACRTLLCSVAGWDISDCNDDTIEASQSESCGTGVILNGSLLSANDSHRIRDLRVEKCTIGINIASANVRYTHISGLWSDGSTPTPIADSGTMTRKIDKYIYVNGAGTIASLNTGTSLVSGANVYVTGATGAYIAATNSSQYLLSQTPDVANAVGTWLGNNPTLTAASTRIIGFTRDNPRLHTQPVSYIDNDGNYEFASGVKVMSGAGSPEGVVTAVVGSMYLRSDGTAGATFYIKESGTGNTGWVAK